MNDRLRRWATGFCLVLAGWVVLQVALPRSTPGGVVLLGVVLGGLNALLAIGVMLVYRSHRIINFAHGELGAFAGVLAVQLVASGWPYAAAVGAGVVTALAAAAIVELAVIRRFRHAPRLILTVATIGVAQILVFAQLMLPRLFDRPVLAATFTTPLSGIRLEVSPVVFNGNHLAILVVTLGVLGVLPLFLRSRPGIGIRALAESAERAALCGIPTVALSTLVWTIAGGLSAVAAILQSPVVGLQVGVLVGPGLLLRALAAAVIARMESLPVAVSASVGIAVLEQAVFWAYGRSSIVDVALLVVILAALLAQRARFARVDPADATTWQVVAEEQRVPALLARVPTVVRLRRASWAVLAVIAVGLPMLLPVSRQNLAAVVMIFALIGASLVVLVGWAGQISLGQFALVGIGAALAGQASADHHVDFVLSLVIGGVGGLVAAVVLGLPALRVRGFFLAVTTLAFAVTTAGYLLHLDWLTPDGPVSRPLLFGRLDLESELTYYYLCLATLVAALASLRSIRASRVGRAIVGTRDNARAAQAYGISAVGSRLTAFAISGFVAGIAGALLVHHQHGLPATQYAPQQSLAVFSLAVIGGLGSLPGAVVGAVYVKGSQYLLTGPWQFLATGAGQLLLLLVLPGGLGSLLFKFRDRVLRVIAERHGLTVPSLNAGRPEPRRPPPDESIRDPLGASPVAAETMA